MAWFRTNRGIAAWLALFALACQLSFSFGHVHIDKFGVGKFGAGHATQAGVETTDRADTPAPAHPKDPVGVAGDFCAVCANISLASALILPVLAFILAPVLFTRVWWPSAAGSPASFHHQSFRARGPPSA
jgi:hypothetical protein